MSNERYREYPVWDPVLRTLHWWNAATMLAQAISGTVLMTMHHDLAPATHANLIDVHAIVGYGFGAGVFARILWLFFGPPTASWRDLIPLTSYQFRVARQTLGYYLHGFRGEPPLYYAHNSLAAAAYVLFFALAAAHVLVGASLLGVPADLREDSSLLEWHEAGFWGLVGFVALHLAAVLLHQVVERRGLVQAMFGGRKLFTPEEMAQLADEKGANLIVSPGTVKGEKEQ